MSDGADLDQIAGLTVSDGEGEALHEIAPPAILDWPSLGIGDDLRDGSVDGFDEISGDVLARLAVLLGRRAQVLRGARVEKERSGATDDVIEFLPDLGPGLELHGTRIDLFGTPSEFLLPCLLDTFLGGFFVEADDDLVSDTSSLIGIELERGLEDLFCSGRHDGFECTSGRSGGLAAFADPRRALLPALTAPRSSLIRPARPPPSARGVAGRGDGEST